jgi:radical SAM superfamily enzyme YgiQ (UPF0313 family)
MKILYLYPNESWGFPSIITCVIRISNFLNSKAHELGESIEEEYLDLRHEKLPKFIPKNLKIYRNNLKSLLNDLFQRFTFDLVAISCYSSFSYINTVEVACFIKYFINPLCKIVVGGTHPTICPEDFQPGNLPEYIYEYYPKNFTPFDFLIKDEGEIPFFKLIQGLINNSIKTRKDESEKCFVLERELLTNLNEIPIINFNLFKKYKHIFDIHKKVYLEFSRGCSFRCKFCPCSTNNIIGYKTVRVKSPTRSLDELRAIKNTDWLSINEVVISDMIFLPKISLRKEFFKELENIYQKEGGFPFRISIVTRVETCRIEDLNLYKNLNMFLGIGVETCSKTLLKTMGKILGKKQDDIERGIDQYFKKLEKIIIEANNIDLPISYYILMGLPGSNDKTIKENWDFFLKPRADGKALAEKNKINLRFNKYLALPGSEIFRKGEEDFGAKIYYKRWWKKFDKHQAYYSMIIDPYENQTFTQSLEQNFKNIKILIKLQNKLRNPFYSIYKLLAIKKDNLVNYKLYKKLLLK